MALMLGSVKFQAFDSSGNPLSAGKVYTYAPGTTTNKATYPTIADAIAATNANANPVILDSRGEANIVLAGKTKILLKDSADATIYTVDNIEGDAASDVMDDNGNPILKFSTTSSAVNSLTVANAATGNSPSVSSTGSDSNVGMKLVVKGTGTFQVEDNGGLEVLKLTPVASAVNEITIANAATGNQPTIYATGGDTNPGINFQAKGTGSYNLGGTATGPATLRFYETTGNGSNYVGLKAAASITADLAYELPSAAPTLNGQVLSSTTAGVLSWTSTPPAVSFKVTMSGSQSVSTATNTKVQFNTEAWDTNSNFDSATNYRFTPTVSGKYLIIIQLAYDSGADTQFMGGFISKNGAQAETHLVRVASTGDRDVIFCAIVDFNGSTDYVEAYAYHTKGSSANLTSNRSYFFGSRVM